MKNLRKYYTVILLAVCVFLAATLCIFAGCVGDDNTPKSKAECVVFDDGYGKKYTLHSGENQAVYYEYDAQKVLKFTRTIYSEATGEVLLSEDCNEDIRCDKSSVYYFWARPANADGEREDCSIKIIVTAHAVSDTLYEKDRYPLSQLVWLDTGATFAFIPEMTGKYTITCECEHEGDIVEVATVNSDGLTVKDGIFECGRKYYIHVKAVNSTNGYWVYVTASVKFTPDIVEEDKESQVTLTEYSNIFEFTPKHSGAYTTVTDADGTFDFLDGETYELVTKYPYCKDAILEGGKKYFIQSTVGYQTPRQASLTVKRVDRVFAHDSENELRWDEISVFTVERASNYKFKVEEEYGGGATNFSIYSYDGWRIYTADFVKNDEFDVTLGAGKYLISVDNNSKVKGYYAPKELTVEKYVKAENGEIFTFTAPLTCVYDFDVYGVSSAEISVTDKDGNEFADKRLVAGESYDIVIVCEDRNYPFSVSVAPVSDGVVLLNKAFTPEENYVYELTSAFTGIYDWGLFAHKFAGASEVQLYDDNCKLIETQKDTVKLFSGRRYYAVIKSENQAEVKLLFYPQAIPYDTGVAITATGYLRVELDEGCCVSLGITHKNNVSCKWLDADLKEVESFEFSADDKANMLTHTFEKGGIYYLYIVSFGSYPEIELIERPQGISGELIAEKGITYKTNTGIKSAFKVERPADGGGIKVEVQEDARMCKLDCIKLYYITESGTKTFLNWRELDGNSSKTVFTYYANENAVEYVLEVESGLQFQLK